MPEKHVPDVSVARIAAGAHAIRVGATGGRDEQDTRFGLVAGARLRGVRRAVRYRGAPGVVSGIARWGLSVTDVRHDVDAMTPAQRVRLARMLTREWKPNATHSVAELQAQYLVTMSLMRESTLFASIISRTSRGLR